MEFFVMRPRLKSLGLVLIMVAAVYYKSSKIWSGGSSPGQPIYKKPDRPTGTVRVLLLSYQRCGSSFIGQLFNQNHNAFYVFEPGDSVYVSMYGINAGWAVPSDITHHWNGQQRSVPMEEITSLAEIITHLYRCDMDLIPSELYLHTFWQMFPESIGRLTPFRDCLEPFKSSLKACRLLHIADQCPMRFGQNSEEHEFCKEELIKSKMAANASATSGDGSSFHNYRSCVEQARHQIEPCISMLKLFCNTSSMVSLKTVRVTMDTVSVLLHSDPNVKVIHLIRDPRAVALSRMDQPSFRGHYSGNDVIKEAVLYCEDVLRDLERRRILQTTYPDTFLEVIYEDFVSDYKQKAKDIYTFLGRDLPKAVDEWLYRHTSLEENSTHIARQWLAHMTYKEVLQINKKCQPLFRTFSHSWP